VLKEIAFTLDHGEVSLHHDDSEHGNAQLGPVFARL
jgi:hypothetical protein